MFCDRLGSFCRSPEITRPDRSWDYLRYTPDDRRNLVVSLYAQAGIRVTAEASMKVCLCMTQKSNLDRRVTRLPVFHCRQSHRRSAP